MNHSAKNLVEKSARSTAGEIGSEMGSILLNLPDTRREIDFVRCQPFGAFPDLPASEYQGKHPDHHILEEKIGNIEVVVDENAIARSKSDDGASDQTNPGGKWLKGCLVR